MKKLQKKMTGLFAVIFLAATGTQAQNVFPTAAGSNVGIGTAAPAYPLSVVRGAGELGTAAFYGSGGGGFASVFNFSTSDNTYIRGGKAGAAVVINDVAGLGNVTIGNATSTVNIVHNLSVAGDISMGAASTIYSPTSLYLAGGTSRTLLSTSGVYGVQTYSYAAPGTGGIFQFVVGGGFVKIGSVTTPNPAGYKLYVDQGILTEKVKVAVAGSVQWADHVFNKDYPLMPLSEVEQFIKKNKHLPNVLSADEMVKEGNDLGKTDAKLLEKIEELTLYMIEIKKENTLLKTMVEQQNKKIEALSHPQNN